MPLSVAVRRTSASDFVRIELIEHDMVDAVSGMALEQPLDKLAEVLLGTRVSTMGLHGSGGDLNGGDQCLGSVAFVLELPGRAACPMTWVGQERCAPRLGSRSSHRR